MKKIISCLKEHLREDFKPGLYGFTAVFLAVTIALNYRYDFEDSIIDSYYGREIRMLWYFLFYGFAWYTTAIAWLVAHRKTALLRTGSFWSYSLFGLAVLGFDGGFYYHYPFTETFLPYDLRDYVYDCLSNLNSLLTILLPLWLFYHFLDRKRDDNFYGFTRQNVDLRPYAWMLLIMAVPIGWASFQADFLGNYPSYKDSAANEYWSVPCGLLAFFFELAYGWDFVATELIFRGFLIIGLANILGRGAVLPMVVTYAFLHFGKPLGETIGSIFGGYILGVIALYSRNIWGGVAIHLGVAWLMELAAGLQLLLRG